MSRGGLVMFVVAALAGCGGAPPPQAVPPSSPPDCIQCRVAVVLDNDMGSSFRLARVEATVDGATLYFPFDPDHDDQAKTILLARDLTLSPGRHVLDVRLVHRGWGFGVFSYLRKYEFKVGASFELWPRKGVTFHVHAYERGGPTTPLEDRPALRVEAAVE